MWFLMYRSHLAVRVMKESSCGNLLEAMQLWEGNANEKLMIERREGGREKVVTCHLEFLQKKCLFQVRFGGEGIEF